MRGRARSLHVVVGPQAEPTRTGEGRAPRTTPPKERGDGDPNQRGSHRDESSRNEGPEPSGGSLAGRSLPFGSVQHHRAPGGQAEPSTVASFKHQGGPSLSGPGRKPTAYAVYSAD